MEKATVSGVRVGVHLGITIFFKRIYFGKDGAVAPPKPPPPMALSSQSLALEDSTASWEAAPTIAGSLFPSATSGSGTYAGDGSRQPTKLLLEQAFHQDKYIANITKKLKEAA